MSGVKEFMDTNSVQIPCCVIGIGRDRLEVKKCAKNQATVPDAEGVAVGRKSSARAEETLVAVSKSVLFVFVPVMYQPHARS